MWGFEITCETTIIGVLRHAIMGSYFIFQDVCTILATPITTLSAYAAKHLRQSCQPVTRDGNLVKRENRRGSGSMGGTTLSRNIPKHKCALFARLIVEMYRLRPMSKSILLSQLASSPLSNPTSTFAEQTG